MKIKETRHEIKRILLMLLAILTMHLFLTHFASAIGVTPARLVINFEPNLEKTITLKILNNEHRDFKAAIFVRGDLSSYITLESNVIELRHDEESKTISYTVKLPAKLDKAGLHKTDIVIREISSAQQDKGFNIGFIISVVSQLYVRVPYPGKYAEISLDILEAKVDDDVRFFVPVLNYGEEEIKAKAKIFIFDNGDELARIDSDEKIVKPKERQELKATWKSTSSGVFRAIAVLHYDGKTARTEKEFFVEEEFLIVPLDIAVEEFRLGEIAKFNILVRNQGNRKVYGVYSQISLFDENNNSIADIRSPAVDIGAFSEHELNVFWDTSDVEEAVYDGKLILGYEDKISEKLIRTEVTANSIKTEIIGITARVVYEEREEIDKNMILIGIILFLLILNIIWFIYFKRRVKK
jgi:hypothetical protein